MPETCGPGGGVGRQIGGGHRARPVDRVELALARQHAAADELSAAAGAGGAATDRATPARPHSPEEGADGAPRPSRWPAARHGQPAAGRAGRLDGDRQRQRQHRDARDVDQAGVEQARLTASAAARPPVATQQAQPARMTIMTAQATAARRVSNARTRGESSARRTTTAALATATAMGQRADRHPGQLGGGEGDEAARVRPVRGDRQRRRPLERGQPAGDEAAVAAGARPAVLEVPAAREQIALAATGPLTA